MNAGIQQKIAPVTASIPKSFSDAPVAAPDKQETKIDFQKLLYNSNQEIKNKKNEEKNADLSGAKDYKSFLETLNHRGQKAPTTKNSMGKDDFLKLFVAQLQHQDPLAPKDGSEMASQLAQFNSLEQMINMNKALERMDTGAKESRQFNLIGYLGKDALVKNGLAHFEAGKIQEAHFELTHPINDVELKVKNDQGTTMYTKSFGALQAGKHPIEWDGTLDDGTKAKDGNYTIFVATKDESGNEIPITVTSRVQIEGVAFDKDGSQITSNAGKIAVEDISSLEERKLEISKKELGPTGPMAKDAPQPPVLNKAPAETPKQSEPSSAPLPLPLS